MSNDLPLVVFDCERMRYANTGLYHYCLQLGNAIRNIPSDQYEVGLYGPEQELINQKPPVIKWHSLNKFWFWNMPSRARIWHTTYQSSNYVPSTSRVKKILTIHDLNFLHEIEDNPVAVQNHIRKLQKNIDCFDAYICISEFAKNDLLTHIDIGNKPVQVIYNGCNRLNHNPAPAVIQPEKPFIFSLGFVNAKKNFHVLIPLLQGNDFELVIAGKHDSGDYVQKIMETATNYGVEKRVKLVGPISENDKAWYFRNCSLFAFPSLAEGFGLPVVEAMQFGKPLLLSKKTSLPEVGGEVACYFEDESPEAMQFAMKLALSTAKEREKDIKTRAGFFDWHETALQHHRLYQSML
ncbi:Glycosyltransferase involved in cell wall bisynthesis [Pseudarcicella hirudinis]|uniref:Glycosyltransferase involved in cell wall bisynthesis n=1 Tax=Pseudarcicella hirudinis TaxID=1079859 RepID=A0A1I5X056_9BACT|nr:glycosyltransferase family 1 protein [Pseudarcicella hirudinis]SFQ25290.1 Glycosyltransferase involved in cell wall bisynthesis [Pseudarcicella hirudinis]